MTDPVVSLLTAEGPSPFETHFDVPAGWQQGRAVFGGLVMAMAVRALERAHAATREGLLAEQPLRTLTAELATGATPGPLVARVSALRVGGGSAIHGVVLEQGGEPRAFVRGTFGKTRTPDVVDHAPHPCLPGPEDVPVVAMGAPLAPEFIGNVEVRPLEPYPFSGSAEGRSAAWFRLRNEVPPALRGAALVALYADISWPAVLSRFDRPRPTVTMAYTLSLVTPLSAIDPAAPLLHVGRTLATHEGYSVELRQLFAPDGRLVAVNPQTFAVLA